MKIIHSLIQQKAQDTHYVSAAVQGAGILEGLAVDKVTFQSNEVLRGRHTQGALEIFFCHEIYCGYSPRKKQP